MPRAKTPKRTPEQKKQLVTLTRRLKKQASTSQIKAAFKDYDLDGDGEITMPELTMAIRRLSSLSDSVATDESAIRRMLKDADVDGDGTISEKEFVRVMALANSGNVDLNWSVVNACASAEITLDEGRETMHSTFGKVEALGRQYSEGLQTKLSTESNEAGAVPRLFALGLDCVYAFFVFLATVALEKSIDGVDFNFFWYAIGAIINTDIKSKVPDVQQYLVDPFLHLLEDALDISSFAMTGSIFALLVGFATYGMVARSQTVGQIIMNHVPVTKENSSARLGALNAMIFYVLSIASLDFFTGLAGTIMGAQVTLAWTMEEEAAPEKKKKKMSTDNDDIKQLEESIGEPLPKLVHSTWLTRSFSDPLVMIVYVASTIYLTTETNKILGSNGSFVSSFKTWLSSYSSYLGLLQDIPSVVFSNAGLIASVVVLSLVSASTLLLALRSLFRPLTASLALVAFGWTFYTAYDLVANDCQPQTFLVYVGAPVLGLRMLYQHRASVGLQISVYKEALAAVVCHPLLTLFGPMCEVAMNIYQFEMFTRYAALEYQYLKGTAPPGTDMLLWGMRLHQVWSLSSMRIVFEMAYASVIGRYYFRKTSGGEGSVARTINGVLGVFLKNAGTGLALGLLQMPLEKLKESLQWMKEQSEKYSWFNPIKWVLFVFVMIVASIVVWLETIHRTAVTYAGITGEGVTSSARRALMVMKTDGLHLVSENVGSKRIGALLTAAAFMVSKYLMDYSWPVLKAQFGAAGASDMQLCLEDGACDQLETGVRGICYTCALYVCFNMIWVLERASSTVTVCVLDEACHDPTRMPHAPQELKESVQSYLKEKRVAPSLIKDIVVMILWVAMSVGIIILLHRDGIKKDVVAPSVLFAMFVAIGA